MSKIVRSLRLAEGGHVWCVSGAAGETREVRLFTLDIDHGIWDRVMVVRGGGVWRIREAIEEVGNEREVGEALLLGMIEEALVRGVGRRRTTPLLDVLCHSSRVNLVDLSTAGDPPPQVRRHLAELGRPHDVQERGDSGGTDQHQERRQRTGNLDTRTERVLKIQSCPSAVMQGST